MTYGLQAALWIVGFAGLGLGARYLLNKGERR
jgi:hypothetical protein